MIISASIDLTKIDKSKIKNHENGSKYYPITIMVADEKDQYGNDVSVIDSQSKEEREAQQKRNYIGNGRVVYKKQSGSPHEGGNTNAGVQSGTPKDDDSLPF